MKKFLSKILAFAIVSLCLGLAVGASPLGRQLNNQDPGIESGGGNGITSVVNGANRIVTSRHSTRRHRAEIRLTGPNATVLSDIGQAGASVSRAVANARFQSAVQTLQ